MIEIFYMIGLAVAVLAIMIICWLIVLIGVAIFAALSGVEIRAAIQPMLDDW